MISKKYELFELNEDDCEIVVPKNMKMPFSTMILIYQFMLVITKIIDSYCALTLGWKIDIMVNHGQ